jgi:hypothetical protein
MKDATRTSLGSEVFEAEFARGREMSADEVAVLAYAATDPATLNQ